MCNCKRDKKSNSLKKIQKNINDLESTSLKIKDIITKINSVLGVN